MNDLSKEQLLESIRQLSEVSAKEKELLPQDSTSLPSIDSLKQIVDLVKAVIFPGFFDKRGVNQVIRPSYIGVNIEMLYTLLKVQIQRGLIFCTGREEETESENASQLALHFIAGLPEIKRLLLTDVEAIYHNDPAVNNYGEVIFCYPVLQAMTHYRVAHKLLKMGIPIIPRIITEQAHSATGIDIHPGAEIGEYFSIDHGTGVVIGETCIIGNHVTLYQGVTLGAKNFKLDKNGKPMNILRHPILEDRVTIYSNSTVLGRVTIGHDSVIGGNVWVTENIPPHSRIVQRKAMPAGTNIDNL